MAEFRKDIERIWIWYTHSFHEVKIALDGSISVFSYVSQDVLVGKHYLHPFRSAVLLLLTAIAVNLLVAFFCFEFVAFWRGQQEPSVLRAQHLLALRYSVPSPFSSLATQELYK